MKPLHFLVTLPLTLAVGAALAAVANPFPEGGNTERTPGGPMAPADVAAQMKMPPGFRCTVFAGEPDVRQPMAIATDARGRLWVAENYTYASGTMPLTDTELRDRIVILEDADNDGVFDKRTVFWEGAIRLSSLEIGRGGIWALCAPNLLFIPDRNHDDVPDAQPEVVLDGFDFLKAKHTVVNGLRWGPDGWLYGRQGINSEAAIGRPGAPAAQRTPVNVGIWRYHPQRQLFEVVAEGTTNPWGMDWEEHGEGFFINTVIGHLWQIIPGAHYRRMRGDDPNPRVYESLEQFADHFHWATSEVWQEVRKGASDATSQAGGGHAHTGLLVYQGGQWPSSWNGKMLTINFHGRRLNVDRLEREGSGFVGRHEPDGFQFPDPWFRGIDLIAAPDGGVLVSDWSDAGECHDLEIHRTSGRIYKLSYGEAKPREVADVAALANVALAKLQLSANDWLSRQARRVLADRAAGGVGLKDAHAELQQLLAHAPNPVHRLRALWALHVSDGVAAADLIALLSDRDEYLRAWAIRLLTDFRQPVAAATLQEFVRLAVSDPAPFVRLALASTLQRLPAAQRARLAAPLLAHGEDRDDHNLPLMLWYGVEGLAAVTDGSFERLVAEGKFAVVQRLAARRLAENIDLAPERLDTLLQQASRGAGESRQAILDGIAQALSGRRKAPRPAGWDKLAAAWAEGANDGLRQRLRELSALFGDGRALEELRAIVGDAAAEVTRRREALDMLIEARAPGLRELCRSLLRERGLAGSAAAGLALDSDPANAAAILEGWPARYPGEAARVMTVLVSRPAWAGQVLDALAAGVIQRTNLDAFQARQIFAFHDAALTQRLTALWGPDPDRSQPDHEAAMAKWLPRFAPDRLRPANLARGREVFKNTCSACHTLNGEGGAIGPDLTGAARDSVAYLLENLLFPSALVPDDYRLTTLTMKDGRVLSGMVRGRTSRTVKLQSMTGPLAVALADVAKEEALPVSLMPAGLLEALSETDARDLMAYLLTK